jgi:two-component system OmpR family sensor kinase
VGVLVLAGGVLVAADFFTYDSLRSFLVQRTDASLEAAHQEVEAALAARPRGQPAGPAGPAPPGANGGVGAPPSANDLQNLTRSLPGLFIQLRAASGKVVYEGQVAEFARTSSAPPAPKLPATIALPEASSANADRVHFLTVPATHGGLRYRVRASIEPRLSATSTLVIATSLAGVDTTLHRLLLIELLVTAVGLAALAVLGIWVVRLGLRPLDAIGSTAAAIASGDLSRRVERAEERTEVGRLGLALNAMLAQIEAAFEARAASEEGLRRSEARLRRFVGDASHELRTPIAAVRAYAELFARGASKRPEDLERAMTGISRESDRMSVLVEDLLLLAHLDEGRALELEPVPLDELVFEAVETAHLVEPARDFAVVVEPVVVLGDRGRLRQVLDNLLGNVRAHTPTDASVAVSVRRVDGQAVLAVEDSGPGMTPDQVDRIFERFYRADPLRARGTGGAGLGLSIVAAVAKAHGGSVSVESEPGRGSAFRIGLPLLDEPDSES